MPVGENTVLFTNCHIHGHPQATEIVCRDGQIVSFGGKTELIPDTVVDLNGGYVYPGFTDSHLHLGGYGAALERIDLVGTTSPGEILKLVDEAVALADSGRCIQGRGWDQNDWLKTDFPNSKILDAVAPDHPVYLKRIDGHAVWVNSKALELANINKETQDPPGGKLIRDKDGQPTGVLIDNAVNLVSKILPSDNVDDKMRQILKAQDILHSLGLTSIHEPGVDQTTVDALRELRKSNRLSLRVYAMLEDDPETFSPFFNNGPETEDDFLKFRSVKLYFDGALGSRGALLLEPYSDDPGNSGLFLTDPDSMKSRVKSLNKVGLQVNIHCIGDKANRFALDIFEEVGNQKLRNRIEHAQTIHPDDIPRFAKLGVIPSMQSTHCTSDMPWVEKRLGRHRLNEAYPWQSLIRAGSLIPNGSDAPVEHPDPIEGIYTAVTRQDKTGRPEGGWLSQARMSMEQALLSFTEWPAFASFQENTLGKIEPGYFADFTVLSDPLESLSGLDILNAKVMYTIVNGEIVYEQKK